MTSTEEGPKTLCCLCGVVIPANPANMCVNCIRSQVDITEGISKEIVINWCKGCGRFAHGTGWVSAQPESRELLAMLVKKVRGLGKVKLVDAGFVWTEPHSKRLKAKLTVQREVFGATGAGSGGAGAILQQSFVVEYILENLYCPDCHKAQSPHTWVAQVQLRQRSVGHKRTLYYVEQLILKNGAHANVTSLKELPDGLDFFFVNNSHAKRFVEFVKSVSPATTSRTKKLIAHDDRSNIYTYKFVRKTVTKFCSFCLRDPKKYTWLVEIAPICRDDLVALPRGGRMGQGGLFLCTKVTSSLHFVDPISLRRIDITGQMYWANPFQSLANASSLHEFTVIDSEPSAVRPAVRPEDTKYQLADVTIARSSDLGSNDVTRVVTTHLGRLLKSGDLALAYDIANSTLDLEEDASRGQWTKRAAQALPDVLLVRKTYRRPQRRRIWTLNRLERDDIDMGPMAEEFAAAAAAGGSAPVRQRGRRTPGAGDDGSGDMERLMQDLEEDPELRAGVALVKVPEAEQIIAERKGKAKDPETMADEAKGDEEPEFPDVTLDELVEPMKNLSLASRRESALAATGEEGEGEEEDDDDDDPVAPAASGTPQAGKKK